MSGALRSRRGLWAAAGLTLLISTQGAAESALPSGFVYLRDIDSSIVQDIRYAVSDNFVGRPLSGYGAAECILRRDVALALARAQAELRSSSLGLKVYDCYRPQRAVRAMIQWAGDPGPDMASKRFFPRLEKHRLFALGFIAARSRHSTGTAVDITLVELSRGPGARFEPRLRYAPCTGPVAERSPDDGIDMGTGYDCFDLNSYTASAAIGADQQKWRRRLLAVMTKHGFRNYYREWWHFAYVHAGPVMHYDVPIAPRQPKTRAAN